MKITLLNHASILFDFGNQKLLCDPWFEGNTFKEGWGLQWEVENSYEIIKECTHLWISHFHEDHLNKKTLKKIISINPNIQVLVNNSFNFNMENLIRSYGFNNTINLTERKKYTFSEELNLTRYPATGIDNFLLIEYQKKRYLNFNDVVLSAPALSLIAKKIGNLEIIFSNFNHAGKLLNSKLKNKDIKKDLIKNFKKYLEQFDSK